MGYPYITAGKWNWVLNVLSKLQKDLTCIKCEGGGGDGGSPSGPAGGSLSGTYPNPSIANSAVANSQISNRAALSVMGRSANSVGVVADITAGTDGHVLRRSGTTLGFGTIATAGITDQAVTYAKIQNSVGLSVLGRSANSTGVNAAITAATDNTILRRSGTSIGFGTIGNNYITDLDAGKINTGTLPIARGGTGLSTLGTSNQQLRVNAGGTALEYFTPSGGGGGGGQVDSITAGTGIDVDATDPVNPEVSLDSATQASLLLADTSLQSGDNISELTNDSNFIDTTAGDARYWKQGGNAASGTLVGGTTTNENVQFIRNGEQRILLPVTSNIVTLSAFNTSSPTTSEVGYGLQARREFRASDVTGQTVIGSLTAPTGSNKFNVVGSSLFQGLSSTTGAIATFENSTGNDAVIIRNDLGVEVKALSGTGTRMVVADSAGTLSTQAIPSGGSTSWGGITGTLSDQTDLQTALDDKVNWSTTAGGTNSGTRYIGSNNNQVIFVSAASERIRINATGATLTGSTVDVGLSSTTGFTYRAQNSSATIVAQFNNNNTVEFNSLSGTGTRMVVADNNGVLNTQAIPASPTWEREKVTGSTSTTINLSNTDIVSESESLFINGLFQDNTSDYSIDYSTGEITLANAPVVSDVITIKYQY